MATYAIVKKKKKKSISCFKEQSSMMHCMLEKAWCTDDRNCASGDILVISRLDVIMGLT